MDVPIQALPQQAAAPAQSGDASAGYAQAIEASPIFKDLVTGKLPAAYAGDNVFGDHAQAVLPVLQQVVEKNKLGYANAPKSNVFVVYNPKKVTAEQIAKADADGTLNKIAAPLERQPAQGDAAAPAADQTAPAAPAPADAAAPAPDAPPPSNVAAGLIPAGAEDDLMRARVGSLTPKPPTGQARPSQGIINGLMARAK